MEASISSHAIRAPATRRRTLLRFAPAFALAGIALLSSRVEGQRIDALQPPETTFSTSRQFVVVGETRQVRGEVARFCEEVRAVWHEAVGISRSGELPVLVVFPEDVRRRPRQPFSTSVLHGDGGSARLQVTVWDRGRLGTPEMAGAIFEALLVEYAARNNPPEEGRAPRLPPPWLREALVQQFLQRGKAPPVGMLEELFSGRRPPTAQSILRRNNPPSSYAELSAFRLLSWSLLRALAEQPDGRNSLRAYLKDPGDWRSDALMEKFPVLEGSFDTLDRLWALGAARLAQTGRSLLLSARETGSELRRLLQLSGELETRGGKEELHGPLALLAIAQNPGGERRLMEIVSSLHQLELRAHPMMAPMVREYREIAHQLARRPRSRLRERIEETMELAEGAEEFSRNVEDALNVYLVNLPGAADPEFQEILRMQSETFSPEPRTDSITLSIDVLEKRLRKR